MRPNDPNLAILVLVAEALGDLREEMVFVGGCAAGLLLTDPAASEIRATKDVDAIVEAASLGQYYKMGDRLPACGFVRDEESSVICRWKHRSSGVLFDMMPVDPSVLGFSNPWYPEAVRTAQRVSLRSGLDIRLVAAPAFVASKLEAFVTRGKSDYLSSHDLEDVLIVVDGRPTLPAEMALATPDLRSAVRERLLPLINDEDFVSTLEGLIDPGSPSEGRWEIVLDRLREMTA